MSPGPPPHVSVGPQVPQQDDCRGVPNPAGFPAHSHAAPHSTHPSPVFVIINPPPTPQQQQQAAAVVGAPPAVAPPPLNIPPPIVIKEENLPSEEELLKIVSLEEKQVEEVRGGDLVTHVCI